MESTSGAEPGHQRQGDQQQGGDSGKGTEQAVDELDPGVKGVEVGVIVPGVVLPESVWRSASKVVPDKWSAGAIHRESRSRIIRPAP